MPLPFNIQCTLAAGWCREKVQRAKQANAQLYTLLSQSEMLALFTQPAVGSPAYAPVGRLLQCARWAHALKWSMGLD